MKTCEHCNRRQSSRVFRIILISIIVFHQCIHVTSSENISLETRYFDLLDEQDYLQLTRKFRLVPESEIEAAFQDLFSEEDWVWTFMTYSDDVRSAWVKQLSSYLTTKPETKKKRGWNLHCLDAHAMCQINTQCANLYSDVIDACNLNRARIFGQVDSPESLAFAAKRARIKAAARKSRRVRKKKCRAFFKRRMKASRPRGPLLIGRSANRPQLITHRRPATSRIRPKLVAGLKKWIKARRRKMKMTQRHVPTMEEVMTKMRYWGGKQHTSVHALMCENLEETCPSTCFESLKRMNSSIYSPLLLNCECKFENLPRNLSNRVESLGFTRPSNLWDEKMCRMQKRLVDNCRPKVYRTFPARRPGCTVVLVKCRKNRVCFRAYREVHKHCAGAVEGRKCPLNCTAAMAELYSKAPSFFRCRPDGLKRPMWMKWRNMSGNCNLKCAAQSEGYNDALTKC